MFGEAGKLVAPPKTKYPAFATAVPSLAAGLAAKQKYFCVNDIVVNIR